MLGRRKGSVDLVPQCWSCIPASMFEEMERPCTDLRYRGEPEQDPRWSDPLHAHIDE